MTASRAFPVNFSPVLWRPSLSQLLPHSHEISYSHDTHSGSLFLINARWIIYSRPRVDTAVPPFLKGKTRSNYSDLRSTSFSLAMLFRKTAGDTSDTVPWILESYHPKKLPAFLRAGFSLGAIIPTRLLNHWMLSSHRKALHLWQCSLTWGQARGMGFGHIKGLTMDPL